MNRLSYDKAVKYESNLCRSIAGLVSVALIAFLAFGAHAQAPPVRLYNVTDLGVLPAKKDRLSIPAAINEQSQVTGTSGMVSVDESAFLYDPMNNKGGLQDLSRNYGWVSRGFAINGVAEVVGDSTFGGSFSHAALFRNGRIADLGTLKGTVSSRATGINATGQVIGFCEPKPEES